MVGKNGGIKEQEKRETKDNRKTKLLVTVTANALMLLSAVLAYLFLSQTYGATVVLLGVASMWAGIFYILRSRGLIDELIENVLIVAFVGAVVVAILLNWNNVGTPYREIIVASSILIVGISLRDVLKFYKEYKGVKIASVLGSENFKFFRRI